MQDIWKSAAATAVVNDSIGEAMTTPVHKNASIASALRTEPKYLHLKHVQEQLSRSGLTLPYFLVHEGASNNTTVIEGRELINFASYNYLALSGDPETSAYAKSAIDRFGTSVSASRVASGEIALHQDLERELSEFLGVPDCLLHVSGHATNVGTIGHLFDHRDIIFHDSFIHNSVIEGCKLSGAQRIAFPHNDAREANRLIDAHRGTYRHALIVLEGVYSVDGDIADLPRFIELKKRYNAFLMVDEAHSLGVLGERGRGIGEHFAVDRADVDLWMGTLSKALGSCGGYIAGDKELIGYLKYTSPAFVFSVGMPPATTAAALAALRILVRQPERVHTLHERGRLFLELAKARGLDTGISLDTAIVPVITGDSVIAVKLADALAEKGINVQPIVYPAVAKDSARLRFFIAADHTIEQIRHTVDATGEALARLRSKGVAP
ncbi:aminotransferase class I/II-fold pyridoxal phosphate-dependent enzyme [Pendulispora albinea]|uniref:8-amino-7-oxononanoate synthase n=1 Tax=Pendulispora albinea TaxID=2741071 RepID=A0ABZ2M8Z6_9BACT